MKIGVTFPQTEIGDDPAAIRDYAQAAEGAGFAHLLIFDHVVGGDTARYPELQGRYNHTTTFHEPLVLFGYLAGLTQRLELVTGILITPQRQTVLIAKQAAEVDVLSGGRLRLGVGIGWNTIEYEALGENFHNRGRRLEEQIDVLRRLWTEPVVDFTGRYHRISSAGIKPLPVQRPIPIWMGSSNTAGGTSEVVVRRIARLADGWFPQFRPVGDAAEQLERLRTYAREAGRDPATIGIEGRMTLSQEPEATWGETIRQWQALGATHLAVNTMGSGFTSPQQHIDAMRRFAEVVLPLAG